MKKTRILSLTAASVFLWISSSQAEALPDQMVTFADFGFVDYVASSIDHVYFATTEGIIRYNKSEGRWEDPLTGSVGVDQRDLRRIWVDTFDQNIFVETGSGYYQYDLLFKKWYPVSELPQLNSDNKHVEPPRIMYAPFSLNYAAGGYLIDRIGRRYAFRDILDDNSGTLWIGTWGYGPAKAGVASDIIDLLPYGLLQNRVNAIYKDRDSLWVSGVVSNSYRTGISIFDTRRNTFSYVESGVDAGFPAVDVNCIAGDGKRALLGTADGVFVYDKEAQRVVQAFSASSGLPDNNVLSLEVLGDSVFVGTEAGLCLITMRGDSTRFIRADQFANRTVYDFEVADSAVWIATEGGAFRLDLNSGNLQKFQDPTRILFGRVYSIVQFKAGLWFAADAGILRLDLKTGGTEPFSSAATNIRARALAVNDRIAAVASDRGVTVIFYTVERPYSREFTTDDGLPSGYVFSLIMDGDYLWIGSSGGLTRFWWNNPNRID